MDFKDFVLSPTEFTPHGEASRAAMDEYAEYICETDSELADGIRAFVMSVEQKIMKKEK